MHQKEKQKCFPRLIWDSTGVLKAIIGSRHAFLSRAEVKTMLLLMGIFAEMNGPWSPELWLGECACTEKLFRDTDACWALGSGF